MIVTPEECTTYRTLGTLAITGMIAGLGVLLASKAVLTPRIVLGRALSSAMLGPIASIGIIWIPNMSLEMKIAGACFIASLGVSTLEKLVQKYFRK